MPEDESRKHVDEDWKRQAKEEKDRLAHEAKPEGSAPGEKSAGDVAAGGHGALPAASWEMIVTNYPLQALIALGQIPNPVTRKQEVNPEHAKHAIDLLGVLEEKTKGNLTPEESKHLGDTLYDLRMRYVSLMRG